jgi:hypothetical protein
LIIVSEPAILMSDRDTTLVAPPVLALRAQAQVTEKAQINAHAVVEVIGLVRRVLYLQHAGALVRIVP